MSTRVTDHSHQVEISLLGIFISDSIEQPREIEVWAQRADDIFSEVRLFSVPHKANGDDLWAVHQHTADFDTLPTVTRAVAVISNGVGCLQQFTKHV